MREKLIELLEEFPKICADGVECKDCQYNKENGGVGCTSLLANHLISHGVVVREKGEWVGDSKEECPFCGERSKWFYENFCPACGADMRGGQHDD